MAEGGRHGPTGKGETINFEVVSNLARAEEIFNRLGQESQLALDLEGKNLGPSGTLSLISIADSKKNIYVIDVLSDDGIIRNNKLKQILESTTIEKVIHAPLNDCVQLRKHQINLRNVFDTQSFQEAIDSYRIGDSRYIKKTNIVELCEGYGIEFEEKRLKSEMKGIMSGKKLPWSRKKMSDTSFILVRPLTRELCWYAASDVKYLLRLRYLMERHLETSYGDAAKTRIRQRYHEYRDACLTKKTGCR